MAQKKTTAETSTALAVADSFQIANRYEGMDPELLAELQDEMEDLDPEVGIACRQIKLPSGGGLAYEVQGEEETDVEYMKVIEGVILFTHRCAGFWPGAYGSEDQNKVPTCSSMDGKTGLWTDTGELRSCETCPMNQFGSAVNQQGQQGRGKACKNMRRLYIMMDGDPNLYLLTVPPTSIRDVNKQLAKIMNGGTPYTGMIVKLSLEKAKNAGGIEYSKVVISKAGLLPPAVSAQIQTMRRKVKEQHQNLAITADDYATAPERGKPVDVSADDWTDDGTLPPEFQDAPPHGDNEAPPPSDGDAPLPFA